MKLFNTPRKIAISVATVVIIIVVVTLIMSRFMPSTDDANVQAFVIPVASDVDGKIMQVYVKDNQYVAKGQKLLQLDQRPFKAALLRAKQDMQVARAKYDQMHTLYQQGAVSRTQLLTAERSLSDTRLQLQAAQYDDSRATVVAPEDGYITNLEVQPGKYAKQGDALMALVNKHHWWVMVNYKENSLSRIKPGQTALVSFNTQPGTIIHAKVSSVAWGVANENNSVYAGLPKIEKTTNWIRLAQRFPVRIELDTQQIHVPLRVGATAIVTVYTSDSMVLRTVAYFAQWLRTHFQYLY